MLGWRKAQGVEVGETPGRINSEKEPALETGRERTLLIEETAHGKFQNDGSK